MHPTLLRIPEKITENQLNLMVRFATVNQEKARWKQTTFEQNERFFSQFPSNILLNSALPPTFFSPSAGPEKDGNIFD